MTLAETVYRPRPARRPWTLEGLLGAPVVYYSLGRWALAEALRAAGVRSGDAVLLPGLICRALLASVARAGAKPLFYRVSRSLALAQRPESLPAARAVLAVDYFGFPQDLEPFYAYRARTGAALIEDAAHALFSRDPAGRPLGTRADYGVFSLHKSLLLPDAGALVGPGPLPSAPGFRGGEDAGFARKRDFLRRTAALDAPRLRAFLDELGRRRPASSKTPPSDLETVLPVGPAADPGLAAPLTAAEPAAEPRRRRALYALCARALRGTGARPVFGPPPPGCAPLAYPFYARPPALARAKRRLSALGLGCVSWPDLPLAVRRAAPSFYGELRAAPFSW